MVITITCANTTTSPFDDLRKAKRMITESLMDFMRDPGSERRLVYELAMSATGSFNFKPTHDGIVQQECPNTHRLIWMKLLFLPMSNFHDKKWIPHGKFLISDQWEQKLIGNTRCTIEVFGFRERGQDSVPVLSNGYVIVSCGTNTSPQEVAQVAAEVDNALRDHQERCSHGCVFFNDSTKVEVGKVAQKGGKFYKGYDEY